MRLRDISRKSNLVLDDVVLGDVRGLVVCEEIYGHGVTTNCDATVRVISETLVGMP